MYADTLLEIAMIHSDSVIERAQNGDEAAINKLVSLWFKRIYNFSYKYFGTHDIAQEVTQKTFIAMYKNIRSLKNKDSFKSWLYRIAANQCHEEERKKNRVKTVSLTNMSTDRDYAEQLPDHSSDLEAKYEVSEMSDIVVEVINTINPEQRQVLIMKEFEGLKFREIAEILNISENTAKSRLYYGLSALKKELEKRNINKRTIYYET